MKRKNKTKKDVLYILNNLRNEDKNELLALWGENWLELSYNNIINTSFQTLIGKNDKTPVAMGGVWAINNEAPNSACVWLLCTREVKKYIKSVLGEIKKEILSADLKYDFLYNIIFTENKAAKRWLKNLGFKFDNPKPKGLIIPKDFEFFYRMRK